MPIYEYRCKACEQITDKYFSSTDAPRILTCKHCSAEDAERIISGAVYHADEATKTAKLDSKYEKKAEAALRNTRSADPDRLLRKMLDFGTDR